MPKPEQSRFMTSHEWIAVDGEVGTVGISDHAQKEITDVVYVELPEKGRVVKKGEQVAVVESVKAAFDIYAPASGEVVEVNEGLGEDPASVNRSPHEDGWFYRLKLSDPKELEELLDYEAYKDHAAKAAS